VTKLDRATVSLAWATLFYTRRKESAEFYRNYQEAAHQAVLFNHPGSWAYERLVIDYEREGRYQEAIEICERYLALPDRDFGQDKDGFGKRRTRLQRKLRQAQEKGRVMKEVRDGGV